MVKVHKAPADSPQAHEVARLSYERDELERELDDVAALDRAGLEFTLQTAMLTGEVAELRHHPSVTTSGLSPAHQTYPLYARSVIEFIDAVDAADLDVPAPSMRRLVLSMLEDAEFEKQAKRIRELAGAHSGHVDDDDEDDDGDLFGDIPYEEFVTSLYDAAYIDWSCEARGKEPVWDAGSLLMFIANRPLTAALYLLRFVADDDANVLRTSARDDGLTTVPAPWTRQWADALKGVTPESVRAHGLEVKLDPCDTESITYECDY